MLTYQRIFVTLLVMHIPRHLRAVETLSIEAAVRANNEFLQTKTAGIRQRGAVRNVGELTDREPDVARVEDSVIDNLMMEMRKMSARMDQLPKPNYLLSGPRQRDSVYGKFSCWIWGKGGHVRSDCPKQEWNQKKNA